MSQNHIEKSKTKNAVNAIHAPKVFLNQKGQVLLLVIVTMTIALALGIGVSLQTLSSLSDVADTDTASRSLAAAEGGAERFLALNKSDLDNWANGTTGSKQVICSNANGTYDSINDECVIDFAPGTNDNITAQAHVSVDYFNSTDTNSNEYVFTLAEGSVKEINLTGVNKDVNLCWNDNGTTDLYYTAYNDLGVVSRNLVNCDGGGCSSYGLSGALDASVGTQGYTSCITLSYDDATNGVPKDVVGLRIRSLNQNATARVSLQNGDPLPTQGFQITSRGNLREDTQIIIQKTVVVYRAYPYMPGIFDFALYSEGGLVGGN